MKKFVAKENFIIDSSGKSPVRINFLNEDFINFFLDKEEDDHESRKLKCEVLVLHRSTIRETFVKLGGNGRADVDLQDIWSWAKEKCQDFEKNSDVYANSSFIFYAYDANNFLRVIEVIFWNDGLEFYAFALDELRDKAIACLLCFQA